MELRKTQNNGKTIISISGTIDTDTSSTLSEALLTLDYADLDLTLDFSHTRYITSAGLRVLLVARRKLPQDKMQIINVNESIAEVFNTTGFGTILNYTVSSGKYTYSPSDASFGFNELLNKKLRNQVNKPVFHFLGRNYNWFDVEKASHIIADDLAKMGVKKGSHVGICSLNSINWIFTFFAIQKLGAIAVLVNPGLMPAEVAKMARISHITHFCYGGIPGKTSFWAFSAAVRKTSNPIKHFYDISDYNDLTDRFDEFDAIRDLYHEAYFADDPSFIIFTSGSTGLPKAVLSSSHNLLQQVLPLVNEFQIGSEDVNCAFLPFFHIFGLVTCIGVGILTDCISYIPEKNTPKRLLSIIEEHQCTLFHSIPTMFMKMILDPEFSSDKVASLRVSALGGATTSEEQMNTLRALFPNNHFANVYGMSENAAISITRYEDSVEHITQTIGVPVHGVDVEIRDLITGEKLKNGEEGEIFIRSDYMIVCYYNLAIDKQPLDGEGWLPTGDVGYIGEDGYMRITCRVKDLIIKGGENISPNEIEGFLTGFDEIADVKVIGVPDKIYGETIAAAIIPAQGEEPDESVIRDFLEAQLTKFKIPTYFVIFDKFPLLGSGKIDAIALKQEVIDRIG